MKRGAEGKRTSLAVEVAKRNPSRLRGCVTRLATVLSFFLVSPHLPTVERCRPQRGGGCSKAQHDGAT